ncbi:MAG: helix-turn-helix domain-containing protein [Sediminibacterium sp.]
MKTKQVLSTDERLEMMEESLNEIKSIVKQLLAKGGIKNDLQEEKILNVNEAVSFLGIEKHLLYAKCAVGDIPCFRIGKLYKFKKSELLKWLSEQGILDNIDPDDVANRYLQKHILKA